MPDDRPTLDYAPWRRQRTPWRESWWFAIALAVVFFVVVSAILFWVIGELFFPVIAPGGGGP